MTLYRVNLMPARKREAKARKVHLAKWGTTLAVYGAMLVLGSFLCRHYADADLGEVESQIRKASVETGVNARVAQGLVEELARSRQKLDTALAVGQQPDWGSLLDLVAKDLGDNLVLEMCRLQRFRGAERAPAAGAPAPGPQEGLGEQFLLNVSGLARSQSDVSACMLRLEQTGLFDRVKLIQTNRHTFLSNNVVGFDLECTFQGSGGASP